MKLIKKGVLSGIIFAMTLLMTACSKYKVKDEQVGQKALFPDYEYNQELAQQIYGQSKMAIAPNGYYYIIDNILYFYNIDSDINMPLCSKVNCRHNDNTCDAYEVQLIQRTAHLNVIVWAKRLCIIMAAYIVLRLLRTGIIICTSMIPHLVTESR